MTCEICKRGPAHRVVDPFLWEIYGEMTERVLCSTCYQARCDDI